MSHIMDDSFCDIGQKIINGLACKSARFINYSETLGVFVEREKQFVIIKDYILFLETGRKGSFNHQVKALKTRGLKIYFAVSYF